MEISGSSNFIKLFFVFYKTKHFSTFHGFLSYVNELLFCVTENAVLLLKCKCCKVFVFLYFSGSSNYNDLFEYST